MNEYLISALIFVIGFNLLITTSGKVVYYLLGLVDTDEVQKQAKRVIDTGYIIGKCENILIYILIWRGDFTALAIIFTAKSIVRKEDIKKDSLYFLAGSLINFTYSIFITLTFKEITKFVAYLEYIKQ